VQAQFDVAVAGLIVDVHHLTHLSAGGTDSPMNLSVLCTAHHSLVHRAPTKLRHSDFETATIEVGNSQLTIVRDVEALLRH
jgi:hypothetical protein